ncbi:carbon-nitrogen hydrolase family protein [Paenibacillus cymbidii]|uniref:carbon-nitrogen hydrolase family protein n=1 Tax=Paenibacillus cymbidii TaxID=1639034 RepID=UPI0010822747|nr:carbon-nitrogen hydrolase family protein [Paenibacillus cymbidii]
MARYITVGCLGPQPLDIAAGTPAEEALALMMAHWRRQLEQVLPDRPDLVVLPEACDRPNQALYPVDEQLAYYRARGDRFRDFLGGIAREHRCYITYPAHTEAEDGSLRNAMQLLDRAGLPMGAYHKNHLVPNEYHKGGIRYGKSALLFACDFGSVAAAICFDLNFDELREQYVRAKPDLIVFPSMYHGGLMQQYWAYSCRSYFAGAIAGLPCTIVTPLGEVAAHSTNYYPFVTARINLDYAIVHIDENGARFPAIKRKYGPEVTIHDPGFLGCVMIASESASFTAADIVAEFGLELLDDYFARSLAERHAPGHMEP